MLQFHRVRAFWRRVTLMGLASVLLVVASQLVLPVSAEALTLRQTQWNLAALGYLKYGQVDGVNGPNTKQAIRSFQSNQCLAVDGVAGASTEAKLVAVLKQVQAKAGVSPADGLGGPKTKAAIERYQRSNKLAVDGMAGPATMAKMGIKRVQTCPKPSGSKIIGDPLSDSSGVACAAGTTNLGVHEAWYNGRKISARLCAIPGFKSSSAESTPGNRYYVAGAKGNVIVNSRVSGAVLAMFRKAKADGITLSANSSFRTHARQTSLFKANPNPQKVARPGYSLHQTGVAIDFDGPQPEGGATCKTRATARGNATWRWLEANARAFGYKQYSAESWHWDTLPASNRC